MTTPEDIKVWIEENLPASQATVSGDGHHFEADVVCKDFAGKNMLERHRMVYQALGDRMKSEIHALSLKTYTPEEK
jgi:acid stress-induced BolA-like protein IbaG/YrbA